MELPEGAAIDAVERFGSIWLVAGVSQHRIRVLGDANTRLRRSHFKADVRILDVSFRANKASARAAVFADMFDFSGYQTLCDVGGATGLLSCLVARRHPHLRCQSLDLPVVEPIARAHIARDGMSGRVEAVSGDFFKDRLPEADIITMGMILHDWNLGGKMKLIQAAYDALPEGGAFVAIENLIDNERRENVFGLMMSAEVPRIASMNSSSRAGSL